MVEAVLLSGKFVVAYDGATGSPESVVVFSDAVFRTLRGTTFARFSCDSLGVIWRADTSMPEDADPLSFPLTTP